jgi:isopentenyl-diphosphate delta-isomerase
MAGSVVLYDIVDKNDQLTGELVDKQTAHENQILHRCSAVLVFDANGGLYVQPHVQTGGKLDNSVGGHVDQGEDYKTAAYREMKEELGLEAELTEVETGFVSNDSRGHIFGIYECIVPESWSFNPNEEVHELYSLKVQNVVEGMESSPEKYTRGFIAVLKRYIEIKKLGLNS